MSLLTLLRQTSFRYVFVDNFTTPVAAGAVNGTAMEPGPGTRNAVDTESKQSITSEGLTWTGGITSPTTGNPGVYANGIARVSGLAMMAQFRPTILSGTAYLGMFATSALGAASDNGILVVNGNIQARGVGSASISHSYDQNFHYDHHIETHCLVHTTGTYTLVRGGMARRSRFVWCEHTSTSATLYPRLANLTHQGAPRRWAVSTDLPAKYTTHYGIATSRIATTVAGDTATHEPDALIEHTITAATGVTQELMVRRADDDNCLIVRMNQGASTIALIQKIGGVETSLSSTSQTWTNATAYIIKATVDGALILVHVGATLKITINNSKVLTSNTGAKVSHAGSNLVCFPRYDTFPMQVAMLDGAILPYGDSKTSGQGDTGYGTTNNDPGYPLRLCNLLPGNWNEEPGRISVGGNTVAQMKATIDADLAGRFNDPSHILVNLGVNNIQFVAGNEAQLISDYGYIFDALHVKYPDAPIYVARVWKNVGTQSEFDLLNNTVIPAAIAGRSWCHLGIDERLILPGASGTGAEYTADGIHPNAAGYDLIAAAWQSVLGY